MCRKPSTVPSYRFRCVTLTSAGSEPGSTAKPWFCDVISTLPELQLLHRMVGAAMAELQLERLAADGEAENLVAEADAEHRHARTFDQLAHVVDRVRQRRGIAGAVAQEDAVGLDRQQVRWRAPSPETRARRSRRRRAGAGCCT